MKWLKKIFNLTLKDIRKQDDEIFKLVTKNRHQEGLDWLFDAFDACDSDYLRKQYSSPWPCIIYEE